MLVDVHVHQVLSRISREGSIVHQLEDLRAENKDLLCKYTAAQVGIHKGRLRVCVCVFRMSIHEKNNCHLGKSSMDQYLYLRSAVCTGRPADCWPCLR
eukprot:1157226-Pelagomonas_calceolata.AAC.4